MGMLAVLRILVGFSSIAHSLGDCGSCDISGSWIFVGGKGEEVYSVKLASDNSFAATRTSSAGSWKSASGSVQACAIDIKYDSGVSDSGDISDDCSAVAWKSSQWARRIELFLIPHTHADVGWLETVDALARMNVSRILDGVVANLQNGTVAGRRRFVWDEMAFLEKWWNDPKTTQDQRNNFTAFVKSGHIELVDNGWSQHDMGATTLDGMMSNWMEGHLWLKDHGLPLPKIGWSLDPFGMSNTQAVMQALMGFDAWFFTRLSNDEVGARKDSRELEFVWQASSSLGATESEMFSHVFESYYCMPLPTYAFEWGTNKGAAAPPPWTDSKRTELAKGLADKAKERAAWFRTNNVLIPWGCDYQFQNAAMVYNATDILIDTINENAAEWGVHVRYATPSEYLDALQASKMSFPTRSSEGTFFPYVPNHDQGAWSGYFTSRPILKGTQRKAESAMNAAELLFARHAASGAPEEQLRGLWEKLEASRRFCGIVNHHDAITGTECRAEEGCSGTNQLVGSHDVLGDYQRMVDEAFLASTSVASAVLAAEAGGKELSYDPTRLGNQLLSGESGMVVVYNPLAVNRVEIVRIPVSVCNVEIAPAASPDKLVLAQVTAELGIPSITAPYYDFVVTFEVTLGPLESQTFLVRPSIGGCGGGDVLLQDQHGRTVGTSHAGQKEVFSTRTAPLDEEEQVERSFWSKHVQAQRALDCTGSAAVCNEADSGEKLSKPPAAAAVVLENAFLQLFVDPLQGLQSVYDKTSKTNFTLQHELVLYDTGVDSKGRSNSNAYKFQPNGVAKPVLADGQTVRSTTVAVGSVMSEVRLQISDEHKTFLRLWQSSDPEVGRRIEVINEIGVLQPRTELSSRFTSSSVATSVKDSVLVSEQNGYERLEHIFSPTIYDGNPALYIPAQYYPSQQSTALRGNTSGVQLSLALDRAKGVATLGPGSLEVMHQRRVQAFDGSGSTVVLDDTDRIHTAMWMSIGETTASNRQREDMKQRLNHPLVLQYAAVDSPSTHAFAAANRIQTSLPKAVLLQSVRATSAKADELVVRLQHLFQAGEDPELSQAASVNVSALVLEAVLGSQQGVSILNCTEVTLNAGMPREDLKRRSFKTDTDTDTMEAVVQGPEASSTTVLLKPFELRTFLVKLSKSTSMGAAYI